MDVEGRVMSYIVTKDGIIYQSDLGDRTKELAEAMQAYNPDTWDKID